MVEVFRTAKDLRRYGLRPGQKDRVSLAYTLCELYPDPPKQWFATVRLCLPYLRPSIIAHEMIHAALLYTERRHRSRCKIPSQPNSKGLIADNSPEETLCYAVERLMAETLIRLEVAGLAPREMVAMEQTRAKDEV
jgi:hypothetical protein